MTAVVGSEPSTLSLALVGLAMLGADWLLRHPVVLTTIVAIVVRTSDSLAAMLIRAH